jgi:hypothetical protein
VQSASPTNDNGLSVGGVVFLHAGIMGTTVYLWCSDIRCYRILSPAHIFGYFSLETCFLCSDNFLLIGQKTSCSVVNRKIFCGYSTDLFFLLLLKYNLLSASLNLSITVMLNLFWIRLILQWFMSFELNRPPKPEESHKNYLGLEPGTPELAVGSQLFLSESEQHQF